MNCHKDELLTCAESAAKFINEYAAGNFIDLLINMLNIAEEKHKSKEEQVQEFLSIIYSIKNSNLDILGGGNTLKIGYKLFIEEFLQVQLNKNQTYIIKNKQFESLSIEELKFILGWTRRLVKTDNNKENRESKNEKAKYKNFNEPKKFKNSKREKIDDDNPFAKLKDYKY